MLAGSVKLEEDHGAEHTYSPLDNKSFIPRLPQYDRLGRPAHCPRLGATTRNSCPSPGLIAIRRLGHLHGICTYPPPGKAGARPSRQAVPTTCRSHTRSGSVARPLLCLSPTLLPSPPAVATTTVPVTACYAAWPRSTTSSEVKARARLRGQIYTIVYDYDTTDMYEGPRTCGLPHTCQTESLLALKVISRFARRAEARY